MFCKKCGTQLPDETEVCPNCGEVLKAPARPAAKEAFKLPNYRGLLSLGFATVLFLLAFTPFIDGNVSVSLLSIEAFNAHATFGIAKIFMIMSLVIYFGYVAVSFIDLGIPSLIKKFIPLCFYGLFLFSQLFVFIGCCILRGVTMGAAWYIILVWLAFAVVFELVPKLFKVDKK